MPLELPEPAARDWLRRGIAQALRATKPVEENAIVASLAWLREPGQHMVALDDACYPPLLREIPDPPPLLFVQGRIELLQGEALAIVGSRNATPQGICDARAFATDLSSRGICIVSGLALGIDAAAHEGGLAAEGSSIAVLGTGPDRVYPPANRALHATLRNRGCIVTEYPPGTIPQPRNFPQRNRLISGLSRGVLVVEAAPDSGSLVTAYRAVQQNREVFVLPGSIHAPLARGCHALARDGAILVTEAGHIVEEIAAWRAMRGSQAGSAPQVRGDSFLDKLGFAPLSLDAVAGLTGLDARNIALRLARLELDGLVQRLAGGLYQRRS